ncbi:MAG: CRTAC1 family protein [Planctomycetes bacterium]|nr:CRTAC1 family protein [Planctomycetota bacterium]
MRCLGASAIFVGLFAGACSRAEDAAPAPVSADGPGAPRAATDAGAQPAEDVVDEARERGLDYTNVSGGREKRTILEANGAGVALLDLGSDGDLDVVFAQGLDALARVLSGPGADLEVFENVGRGRFRRVAGPGLSGWWTGLATGDVDGDGDPDLVAAGYGALEVLLQDERGALVPRKGAAPLPAEPGARLEIGAARSKGTAPAWATSIALFDADRDGALDLYVGQYVDLDPLAPPLSALGEGALAVPCRWKGHAVFCGPAGLPAQPDRLLRGRGDGTFVDESAARLLEQRPGYTLAVLPFDADQDGDTDVFVANDSTANLLWINDGRGVFRDHAYEASVAYSADGRAQAGMGAATADVNRDGLPDFVVTNFSDEPTELYLGSPMGFARATYTSGLARETKRLLSWSPHLVDLDGDGWSELLQTNGHVYPQADEALSGTSYAQPITAWTFGADGRARARVARGPNSLFAPLATHGARGAAIGDVDGDGAPDVVVARLDGPCALGLNRLGRDAHRLEVRCEGPRAPRAPEANGPRTPRDGHGARVLVVVGSGAEEHALYGEAQTAQGYQSASSPALAFGLGAAERYASLRVLWPSGRVETLPGGPADRRLVVREGEGVVASTEFAR